jgi:hypothetical protein
MVIETQLKQAAMFHFIVSTVGNLTQATKTFKFETRQEGHNFMATYKLSHRVIDIIFQ